VKNIYKKLFLSLILFIFIISRVYSIIALNIQQNKIIKRARDMVCVKWTSPQDMSMWNSNEKFQKGKIYEGIPYTMSTNQVRNPKEFLKEISGKNSLEFIGNNCEGPNYGNDCSGFVSAAWNIPRCTTRDIERYTKHISFEQLKPGDALLTDDHIILFLNWNEVNHSSLTVFEQTPPKARMKTYSVTYLKSKNYQPIRLK